MTAHTAPLSHEDKVMAFSKEEVLAVKDPLILFGETTLSQNRVFRKLRSKWYPKTGGTSEDSEAVRHIKDLYSELKSRLEAGVAIKPGAKVVEFDLDDAHLTCEYQEVRNISGFADAYLGPTNLWYKVPAENSDLAGIWHDNYAELHKVVKNIANAADGLRGFFHSTLYPQRKSSDASYSLLRLELLPDYISLASLIQVKKHLDPRHVAWMITRLLNYVCLMERAGIYCVGLSPEAILVQPGSHDLIVAEGWQYHSSSGRLLAVPATTARVCPGMVASRSPNPRHMNALVKYVARCALGDSTGMSLPADVPLELAAWVNSPDQSHPVRELHNWNSLKVRAFGSPRFIQWDLTRRAFYF